MKIIAPSVSQTLKSLLRADFTVQFRQRRSPIMATLLAVVLLVSWKGFANGDKGSLILLGACISIALMGMGLLGYPTMVARDRERGVFQRLRTTPVFTWTIMVSRFIVQMTVIGLMTCIILLVAFFINHIKLGVGGYVLTVIASMLCGGVFLAIGQMLVGFIKSSEAVQSAGRFIYFPLVFGGALAELGMLGEVTRKIVDWSPYGVVQSVLQAAMNSSSWNIHAWLAVVLTLGYILLFSTVGIKWFQWNN